MAEEKKATESTVRTNDDIFEAQITKKEPPTQEPPTQPDVQHTTTEDIDDLLKGKPNSTFILMFHFFLHFFFIFNSSFS